jgi:peptide/nickel transport system substrate-binding protein
MRDSNDIQTEIWNEDTGGFPFTGAPKYDPRTSPGLAFAPLVRQWYATGGKEGVEPTPEMKKIVEIIDKAKTVSPEERANLVRNRSSYGSISAYEVGIVGLSPMVRRRGCQQQHEEHPADAGNDGARRATRAQGDFLIRSIT